MQTALYREHVQHGAQMVDFCGWQMPLHYGSQLQEHHHVRVSVGMFDVSHMGVVEIQGSDAYYFLRYVLANDVAKLTEPGRALYSCLLNESGGILDDTIAYFIAPQHYRLVINAGSREHVMRWLREQADRYDVVLTLRDDLSILAVQGPDAVARVVAALKKTPIATQLPSLAPFQFVSDDTYFIARTGYTGEDGVEIILPNAKVQALWKALLKEKVPPCGLGARDSLRLEAGLNLYGADMNEQVSPLESNLAWTVSWKDAERRFIGRDSLERQLKHGVQQQLIGVIMEAPGMIRAHDVLFFADGRQGEVTSGGYSPALGRSIAFARVPANTTAAAHINYRGKSIPVKLVKPPFVARPKTVSTC